MNEVEKLTRELEQAYREELQSIQNWNGGETLILSPTYFKIRDITVRLISLVGMVQATKIQEDTYKRTLTKPGGK